MALACSSAVFANSDFDTLDVDGSGTISQAEASVDAELTALFAELDIDGNGELSKAEFAEY
jgi:Ca2+-binding EF-hand superfamily protein